MIDELKLCELKVGHFVIEIAKQQGNFHLSNADYIKSLAVIENLKSKGVKTVRIDTGKSQLPVEATTPKAADKSKNSLGKSLPTEHPVMLEINHAKTLFKKSKEISSKVFDDASSGRKIDIGPVVEITNNTIDTIFTNPDALACIINLRQKDDYLLEHSVAVSVLMALFCRFLKIDKDITHELTVGAFLHDVGKIMVPDNILHKPGKLNESEFSIMKTHVNHSISIIKGIIGVSPLSLEVAALHHEKINGAGYPFNIAGKDISQYGRMIAICDVFDALTANRVYKDGYSHVKSFSILQHLADDGQLDSQLVKAFIKCMGVYPVGSLVKLGSNKLAIVEGRNEDDPANPVVRSFYNPQEKCYEESIGIDLSTNDDFIEKGVRADEFDLDMAQIMEFLLLEG